MQITQLSIDVVKNLFCINKIFGVSKNIFTKVLNKYEKEERFYRNAENPAVIRHRAKYGKNAIKKENNIFVEGKE